MNKYKDKLSRWKRNLKKKRDRREYVRLKAHHLIKCRKLNEGRKRLLFARDIGAGGALFHREEEFPLGTLLEIWINFPAFHVPIKTISRVVWLSPEKKIGGFTIGVEFIEIDQEARAFMEERIGKKKKEGKT